MKHPADASGILAASLDAEAPNRLASAAGLTLDGPNALVQGYQNYVLTPGGPRVAQHDQALLAKHLLLGPCLTRELAGGGVSFLDLGANAAYFCFLALRCCAAHATAVDMDATYMDLVRRAAAHTQTRGLRAVTGSVQSWGEPADVVLALALIHWVQRATASFGTLENTIAWLAQLARRTLFIEWIDPEDPLVAAFGHLEGAERDAYNRPAFETALRRHFARIEPLGAVSPTRQIYAAYKNQPQIRTAAPLPLLYSEQTVISERLLSIHHGTRYWSRVYDLGESICKQTTLDLAARESKLLRRVAGGPFPRVLSSESGGDASVVILEKIRGTPLPAALEQLRVDAALRWQFAEGCLAILDHLAQAQVQHRDINPENIIVRDGRPVLIDFGWAVAPDLPIFTPLELNVRPDMSYRPADGPATDMYAMGCVLMSAAGEPGVLLRQVAHLMSHPEPALRVNDRALLRALLATEETSAGSTVGE